jgi:uncharacterized membrane protein
VARLVPHLSEWRRERLRTTLWVVPTIEVVAAILLFVVTYALDRAAYQGDVTFPGWVNGGSADAARQILTATAAAVITVVGLVFSITIVALTLASTQFGPRILRNFVRDRGTQVTLGTFVATFVYSVLVLGSVGHNGNQFVPHLSITVALGLLLVDLGVLIYFIHHVAMSIQLPEVMASIARDLSVAIKAEVAHSGSAPNRPVELGADDVELLARIAREGATVPATTSGYLQFVGYPTLVEIGNQADAVIELLYRPGHFVVEGLPLAKVWPPAAAADVARGLARAHATGAQRTLAQDLAFAIDQLEEIAIRALSPAVNDTFTALTCIDWLADGLCKITAQWSPDRFHRNTEGRVRVIAAEAVYSRLVDRAFDKIRQAGRGMPAVMIRQLDSIASITEYTTTDEQRDVLSRQADMIWRSTCEAVPEPDDRADVERSYRAAAAAAAREVPAAIAAPGGVGTPAKKT